MRNGGDRIAQAVLAGSICLVLVWTAFALTPSSYGGFLASIGAQETGILAGQPRLVRMDEWSVLTPYFQAAVRNRFERFNRTSLYGEDLRNINALPLRDWGLIFKPQLWAFFVLPPANAFGYYFGVLMAAFLAGYFFLFREFNLDAGYALAASLLLFCCGFSQFWWTSSGPSLCLFPWVGLAFLRPGSWWLRMPLCAYTMAVWAIACGYPILILSCGFAFAVLVAALRSETLRSVPRIAAASAGFALAGGLVYYYFADAIRAMSQSVYPGRRFAPPGTVPGAVLVSQFWPAFTFAAGGFRKLLGIDICELGTVGSFLPMWTVCALDYSRLWRSIGDPACRGLRWALAIIASGFLLSTWWMAGRCPIWIGRVLFWNRFPADRLLFMSGLLLLTGCLILWQRGLVTVTPLRAAIFVALGPIASIAAKMSVFGVSASDTKVDWLCAALAVACALATLRLSRPRAAQIMLAAVLGINAILFLRFNPLQSADPIFDIPDSNTVELLKVQQEQTPGAYLAVEGYRAAVLNGLGFRSVSHLLISPKPEFFRQYFPNMDRERFDYVFNRYGAIAPREIPLPNAPDVDNIEVPIEVFRPIRNLRRAAAETGDGRCPAVRESVNTFGLSLRSQDGETTIEGWAPWIGESASQTIFIRTRRPVAIRSVTTVRRLDVAESVHNYQMEKAGFRVVLDAQDHGPLSLGDMRIAANGTPSGRIWIDGCPAE